jgi:ABC-2 type transport system ATP-binding protein
MNAYRHAIETKDLSKSFGAVHALVGLNLRVRRGEVFGFLGPNGSGKSTTLKLLLDEIRPTSGRARVVGYDTQTERLEVHRRVGYLPGEFRLPKNSSALEYLDFLAALRGGTDLAFRTELIDRFGLDPTRRLGQLSTGNRQKVGLVQAFMHRPPLVLLDEPTTGLDPLVQHDVHGLLAELADGGATVLLSSHTLSEVDRVADRVGILRDGALVTVSSLAKLKEQTRRRIDIGFGDTPPDSLWAGVPGAVEVARHGNVATVTYSGAADAVLRQAVSHGEVLSVNTPETDLEDVFLGFYRSGGADQCR